MSLKHEVQQQNWMCKRISIGGLTQDSSPTWQALWMETFAGSMSSLDRSNRTYIRKIGMLSQVTARLNRHSETVAVITVPWKLQKPWFPEQQQNSRWGSGFSLACGSLVLMSDGKDIAVCENMDSIGNTPGTGKHIQRNGPSKHGLQCSYTLTALILPLDISCGAGRYHQLPMWFFFFLLSWVVVSRLCHFTPG